MKGQVHRVLKEQFYSRCFTHPEKAPGCTEQMYSNGRDVQTHQVTGLLLGVMLLSLHVETERATYHKPH